MLCPTANLLICFTHSACSSNSLMGTKYQWRQILWQSSSSAEISDANVRWHLFSFFAQKFLPRNKRRHCRSMTAVHYPNCSPGIESYSFREEAMTAIFTLAPRAGFYPGEVTSPVKCRWFLITDAAEGVAVNKTGWEKRNCVGCTYALKRASEEWNVVLMEIGGFDKIRNSGYTCAEIFWVDIEYVFLSGMHNKWEKMFYFHLLKCNRITLRFNLREI